MNKYCKRLEAVGLTLILLITSVNVVFAEGSLQLNPNDDGKRTYLEYKGATQFSVSGKSTLYVVARAGETITLAGSILASYDGNDIVVTSMKDGRVWNFDVTASAGFIANRAAEKAGPYYPATGAQGNKYVPLTFTVPFDGIYSVEFHTMSGTGSIPYDANPKNQRCDAAWSQNYSHNGTQSQGDGIAAWDVSVFDAQNNLQTGRMYAPYLVISDGDIGTTDGAKGIYANLYLLTHDGYLYRINTNGMDPDGMTFYSDNVGLIDNGSNQTLYKHTNSKNITAGDVSVVAPNCDPEFDRMTHRIFFNKPDESITDILNIVTSPQDYASITCDEITFKGNRSTTDNDGKANVGMGGVFSVAFSKACTYELIIDVNQDGVFDGNDRILMDAANAGKNILLWNGKDENHEAVPSGTYGVQLKVHGGELHLPMSDLEDNVNGYELYLTNTLASGSSSYDDDKQYRIWYDGSDYYTFDGTYVQIHSDIAGALIGNGSTTVHEPSPYVVSYDEMLSSRIGSDGVGGFKFYSDAPAYNRGYGNNRILDVWTYSTAPDALYGTFEVISDADDYGYITGTAYFDKNKSGAYDSGENPAGGLTIILCDKDKKVVFDANGDTIKTTTNNGGKYAFAGVPYADGVTTQYYLYVEPAMADGNAYSLTNTNASGQYVPVGITTNETYKQDIFGVGNYDVKVAIKASKSTIYSGDAITFTITVSNVSSSISVTDVYVNIPQLLPENISGDEVAKMQDKTSDTYFDGIWTVGTLSPSESHIMTLTVHPISSVDATFTQSATAVVDNASGDCNENNNTASVSYKVKHVDTATLVYDCNGCGEVITYDISNVALFNAGSGSVSNTVIELPDNFTRDCFTFIGWGEDETTSVTHNPGDKLIDLVGGDELHMYAIWQGDDITYTVNHYAMVDGVKTTTKVAASQTLTAQVGDVVEPEAVVVTGYTYAEADAAATIECGVSTVLNVYYEPKDVKITWYVSAGANLSETQKYGTSISAKPISSVTTLTDDESTAYDFVGWSLEKNGAVITDWTTQTATEIITYYAVIADLTISAPDDLTYDGTQKSAIVTPSSDWTKSVSSVYYTGTSGTSYSKTTTAPTNVGTYVASLTSGSHTISVTYTIAKADISPAVSIANWREGNTASTPTVTGNLGNGTVTYTYYTNEACTTKTGTSNANGKASTTGGRPTKAGTYYLVATIAATTNYNAATATTSFMITSYTVTAPTARSLTYTGSAQQLANAGSVDNSYTMRYCLTSNGTYTTNIASLTGTDAGTYTLYYGIYSGSTLKAGPSFITITIDKAASSATVAANSLTYNATSQALVTPTSVVGGTLKYRLSATDEWSESIPTATSAGNYTVNYYVEGDDNHEDSEVSQVEVTIAKASVTVTAENNGKVYGDTDPELTYVVSGLLGADVLHGSLERVSGESVGTYAINQGTLSAGNNYTISSFTAATFTISKADAVVPSVVANELTYNGSTQKLVTAGTTDSGTLKFSTDGSTWSTTIPQKKDAGIYTVYYYVVGDANHENSSVHTLAVTIAQKELTIVADDLSKTYGATDPTLTYTVSGLLGTDKLTGALTRVSGESVGTYAISQGTLSCGSNYTVASFTGATFTITKAAPTVTAPKSKTLNYTGSAQTLATAGSATGGTIYYSLSATGSWSTALPKGTTAGDYTIYYYVKGDDNHTDTEVASITSTIKKAAPTVTAPKSKTLNYTGSVQTLATAGSATGGTIYYRLSETDDWSTALPKGTDAGDYTIYYYVKGDDNHSDTEVASITSTIKKVAPTVTAPTPKTLNYNGSAQILANAGTTKGGTLYYSLSATGSWSTTLPKGTDAGDYTIYYYVKGDDNHTDTEVASIVSTIKKVAPTVTAPIGKTLNYTGSAQALATAGSATGGTIYYRLSASDEWQTTVPTAINVGSYTIYYYVKGDDNHTDSSVLSVSSTINKVAPTLIKPTALALDYNGSAQALATAGSASGGTLYYSLSSSGSWQTTVPNGTNVGSYTVYYYVKGDANHTDTEVASVVSTINKVAPTLTAPTPKTLTYNGSAQILANAGTATGGTLYYGLSASGPWTTTIPSGKEVGQYTVYYYVKGDANHTDTEVASVVSSINKVAATVTTAPKSKTLNYTGSAQTLATAGSATGGTLYYRLSETDDWSTTLPKGTDAGDYTIYYYVKGDDNHSDTEVASITSIIKKVAPTVTAPTPKTLDYTGSAQTLATAGTATGGTILYALSSSGPWSEVIPTGINVGSYTIYYYVKGDDNHTDTTPATIIAKINKVAPDYTEPTSLTLTYTSEAQELVGAASADGGVVYYSLKSNSGWSTDIPTATNIGTYNVYYYVEGDDNHSNIAVKSVSSTILAKTLTITAIDNGKVYGTTDPTLTYTVEGLVGSDKVTGKLARSAGENVGEYAINQGTLSVSSNYTIDFVSGIFTISKASLDAFSVSIANWTYGATAKKPSVSGNKSNGTVTYTYYVDAECTTPTSETDGATAEGAVPANAGTYYLQAVVAETGNYASAVATTNFSINKAQATVTAPTAADLTYNGELQKLLTTVATSTDGTVRYAVDGIWRENIPSAVKAGDYVVQYYVVGDANHADSEVKEIVVTIKRATSTFTAPTALTLTYNDTAQELVFPGTTDSGTMKYSTDKVNWQTTIPTGTDAGLYTIYYYVEGDENHKNSAEGHVNTTIGKADLELTLTMASWTYGDTPSEPVLSGNVGNGEVDYIYYTDEDCTIETNASNGASISGIQPTEVGTYYVKAIVEATANYNAGENVASFQITPEGLSIVAPESNILVYNGSAQELLKAGSADGGTLYYRLEGETEWSTTIPTATDADTYKVYYYVKGDADHLSTTEAAISVTIAQAQATFTAPTGVSVEYNGESQLLLSEVGTALGGTMYYSLDATTWSIEIPEATAVGSYTVYYYVEAINANYKNSEIGYVSSQIGSIEATAEYPEVRHLIYNGELQELITPGSTTEGVIKYRRSESEEWTEVIPSAVEVGTYTIYAQLVAFEGYEDLEFPVLIATIDKAQVDIPAEDPTTFIFDGKEKTYGIASSALYTIVNATHTNVGTYTVTVKLNDTANYEWTDGTTTDKTYAMVIHKTTVGQNDNETHTYAYDGTPQTIDIPESDQYTITNGTHTDAGTYEVIVKLVDPENTTWSDGTTDDKVILMVIEKAQVEIPAADTTTYYFNTHEITYIIAENDHYTVSDNVQTEVGTYIVSVALNDTNNYEWTDGTVENKQYEFVINEAIEFEDAFIIRLWNDVLAIDNSAGYFTTYQWYKNGELIEGATGQYYNDPAGIAGTYYCVVNGKATVGPKTYTKQQSATMKAYGTTRKATIEVSGLVDGDSDVVIYDVKGQRISTLKASALNNILTISLPQGIYVVQLMVDDVPTSTAKILVK